MAIEYSVFILPWNGPYLLTAWFVSGQHISARMECIGVPGYKHIGLKRAVLLGFMPHTTIYIERYRSALL